jgi:hypothetical protein
MLEAVGSGYQTTGIATLPIMQVPTYGVSKLVYNITSVDA